MKKIFAVAVLVLALAGIAAAESQAAKHEYDNHCALGVSMNTTVACDPTYSADTTWTDAASGKHYCFTNAANKTTFAKDTTGNTKKANANWPAMMAKMHGHEHEGEHTH